MSSGGAGILQGRVIFQFNVFKLFAALIGLCLLSACPTTSTTEVLSNIAPPPPLTSEKYAAIVVDAGTGRALYKANDTAMRYPASLTKMMTLYMLFEALQ